MRAEKGIKCGLLLNRHEAEALHLIQLLCVFLLLSPPSIPELDKLLLLRDLRAHCCEHPPLLRIALDSYLCLRGNYNNNYLY